MKRSTRVLLVLVLIELGIGALWLWLISELKAGRLHASGDPGEAIATLSTTLGGAMGVIAGITLAIWWVLRGKGN